MRKLGIILASVVAICLLGSAVAGYVIGPTIAHPFRAPLDAERVTYVDQMLQQIGATREDFVVTAPDGISLRGWKIRAPAPNGDWVLLFHGLGDNRAGMGAFAEFLLRAGYGTVMMDSRAQGESGGSVATYGWLERRDTSAIVNALKSAEKPRRVFALGVSMGASIALQSAAIEPQIDAVVAEDPFADMREVTYDYTGLHRWPWLGKTLFRPASIEALHRAAQAGQFNPDEVSPKAAVAERPFPVLLICGTADHTIPCRHAEAIYRAARGRKELWVVAGAEHASAFGSAPEEYGKRILEFFRTANCPARIPCNPASSHLKVFCLPISPPAPKAAMPTRKSNHSAGRRLQKKEF